jgi:hypothetical protein
VKRSAIIVIAQLGIRLANSRAVDKPMTPAPMMAMDIGSLMVTSSVPPAFEKTKVHKLAAPEQA